MESTCDFKIFGFTLDGQLRVNLYHGPDYPSPGHLYSWVTAKSSGHLAAKLERTWEPVSEAEWDAIDELEAARFACETCGGSGADPGAIDPAGEVCPDCSGSGIEPFLVMLRRSLGTWKPSRPASRKTPGRKHTSEDGKWCASCEKDLSDCGCCPHHHGTPVQDCDCELAISMRIEEVARPASRKTPETVPALRGFGQPVTRPGYADIGNGLYVRTGRRS